MEEGVGLDLRGIKVVCGFSTALERGLCPVCVCVPYDDKPSCSSAWSVDCYIVGVVVFKTLLKWY